MRRNRAISLSAIFAVFAFLSVGSAQQRRPQDVELQAAIRTETVDGDLNAAIKQYAAIVSKYTSDRGVAATALVHMAECYQKLGDAQARTIFERVVRDFADQGDVAARARARLAGSASSVMNARLVWSGPKVDPLGTISPDGRYMSNTNWDTGDLEIHEFATGVDRRITEAAKGVSGKWPEFAEESAISRDGKRVAYSWWQGKNNRYELRVANLAGAANPARLYDNPDVAWLMPFDWSPDGKSVAVEIARIDHTNQLGLVSIADGSLKVLKSIEWRKAGRAFFSPDGRWIGYDVPESAANPEHHVAVMAADGSRELHVDHHGQDEMVGWSPDGKWLLFSSDRSGSMDLFGAAVTPAGSLGSPQLLKAGFARTTPLGVSSSGALYYAQARGGSRSRIQVASIDVAAGKVAPTVDLPQSSQDSYTNPAWSPDGQRLAYVSSRGPLGGQTHALIVRSNETRQVRDLPTKLTYLTLSSWAPDGRTLLVSGRDFKGRAGLFLVDAETGALKPVGPDEQFLGNSYRSIWAPDGRSFVIERGEGLFQVDAATGATSQVLPMPPTQGSWGLYPHWAPDARHIYYQRVFSAKDGAIEDCATVERDLASGAEREVVRKPGFVCIPRPTPDGRHLLMENADATANARVMRLIPLDGSTPRELMRVASGVKPQDLNNPNLGQAMIMPALYASDPMLVVKRLGDRVGFLLNGKEPSELWLVPLTGGEPTKIGHTPPGLTGIAVNPDGRRLAFAVIDGGSRPSNEIWTLENFLPR